MIRNCCWYWKYVVLQLSHHFYTTAKSLTLKQSNIRRLAEIKFMRHKAGTSLLHHRRNEDISELKGDRVEKKSAQHKHKWLNYVSWMEGVRYPPQPKPLNFRPIIPRRG